MASVQFGCLQLRHGREVGNDDVDAFLSIVRRLALDTRRRIQRFSPSPSSAAALQVGQETTLGLCCWRGNVISHHRCFTGHLADASHTMPREF